MLAEQGELTAADVGRAVAAGDPVAVQLIRDSGRRVGQVLASLVSFFNPGLIVIGGGVTGLGHALLAEIRGVTYRRSLPLATGNLPIVLSELGDEGGVVGAARLISGAVYSSDPEPRGLSRGRPGHRISGLRPWPHFVQYVTKVCTLAPANRGRDPCAQPRPAP